MGVIAKIQAALTGEKKYNNTYWLLRHGRSLANEAEVIVSTRENGVMEKWGLAPLGKEQATAAGKKLAEHLQGAEQPCLVMVSPFARTMETAKLAAAEVNVLPESFQVREELVERSFGAAAELGPYAGNYDAAWAKDTEDLDARPGGDGESVNMVITRLKGLFQELESTYQGRNILLVSHGDVCSICQASMAPKGGDPHFHIRDCAFENCELKRLN